MDARNRTIPDWWTRIKSGQLLLPRFQRDQAWGFTEVGALLEAMLRNLPSGAVLVLEIGAIEPFKSRPVVARPHPPSAAMNTSLMVSSALLQSGGVSPMTTKIGHGLSGPSWTRSMS